VAERNHPADQLKRPENKRFTGDGLGMGADGLSWRRLGENDDNRYMVHQLHEQKLECLVYLGELGCTLVKFERQEVHQSSPGFTKPIAFRWVFARVHWFKPF
jgi:hypothetical protein